VTGSDGAAWLDGDAARAAACDASVTPVVTGEVHYGTTTAWNPDKTRVLHSHSPPAEPG
jgi:hypothetical protein